MFKLTGEDKIYSTIEVLYKELTDLNLFVTHLKDLKTVIEIKENEAHIIIAPGFSFIKTELDTKIVSDPNGADGSMVTITSKGIGTSSTSLATFLLKKEEDGVIINWSMEITELSGLLKLVPHTLLKGAAGVVIAGLISSLKSKFPKEENATAKSE